MTVRGEVLRQKSTPLGTPGRMEIADLEFQCDTLEPPWANNQRGKSCVIADRYVGRVWFSPSLKRKVIRYEDRNGRFDCLIHNANFAAAGEEDIDGDGVPEVTQIHGCTAVGRGYGEILRKDGRKQWGILNSVKTLEELISSLEIPGELHTINAAGFVSGYEDVVMTYHWAPGCDPASAV